MDLSSLDIGKKREMLNLLEERRRRDSHRHLFSLFPDTGPLRRELYTKHLAFFRAGTKYSERCIMAANRIGKTEGCTGYEATLHLTGLYPKWWEGKRFDRPIRMWAAGTSAETTRDILQRKLIGPLDDVGSGLIPKDHIIGSPKRDSGIPDAIETVLVRHVSGGSSRLQFKAYKQGRKSFEGDELDLILLDEEPPEDIYTECLTRLMTTKGHILLGFTPLDGLSATVMLFMPGGQVPIEVVNGRFVVGATWDDAPHLGAAEKAKMLLAYPPYQRNARTKGIPQLGSGAIYPVDEDDVLVSDFEIPLYWPRAYALDVGWSCTATLWGAWDLETSTLYLTSEYKRGQAEPASHVQAIKSRGEWMSGVVDPAAAGSNQKDGTKLMEEYGALGLDLFPADNSVEAGLFECYLRMTTGRLKVFKSLRGWLEEFRVYRRDKNGKVVKDNDHLMDDMRYLVMSGREVAKTVATDAYRKKSVTNILDTIGVA